MLIFVCFPLLVCLFLGCVWACFDLLLSLIHSQTTRLLPYRPPQCVYHGLKSPLLFLPKPYLYKMPGVKLMLYAEKDYLSYTKKLPSRIPLTGAMTET